MIKSIGTIVKSCQSFGTIGDKRKGNERVQQFIDTGAVVQKVLPSINNAGVRSLTVIEAAGAGTAAGASAARARQLFDEGPPTGAAVGAPK
jgi:hypothetical protein